MAVDFRGGEHLTGAVGDRSSNVTDVGLPGYTAASRTLETANGCGTAPNDSTYWPGPSGAPPRAADPGPETAESAPKGEVWSSFVRSGFPVGHRTADGEVAARATPLTPLARLNHTRTPVCGVIRRTDVSPGSPDRKIVGLLGSRGNEPSDRNSRAIPARNETLGTNPKPVSLPMSATSRYVSSSVDWSSVSSGLPPQHLAVPDDRHGPAGHVPPQVPRHLDQGVRRILARTVDGEGASDHDRQPVHRRIRGAVPLPRQF